MLGFPKLAFYENDYSQYAQSLLGSTLTDILRENRRLNQKEVAQIGL